MEEAPRHERLLKRPGRRLSLVQGKGRSAIPEEVVRFKDSSIAPTALVLAIAVLVNGVRLRSAVGRVHGLVLRRKGVVEVVTSQTGPGHSNLLEGLFLTRVILLAAQSRVVT